MVLSLMLGVLWYALLFLTLPVAFDLSKSTSFPGQSAGADFLHLPRFSDRLPGDGTRI